MTETPRITFDPEKLRDERRDVDLGADETDFGRAGDDGSAAPQRNSLDEPTAGVTPPAR